jgi:hypothetical protein
MRFLKYVLHEEPWTGGLAMGYLWSRIVTQVSVSDASSLSGTSLFADTLDSFSTISQEKRHEQLPSWYFPL